MPSARERDGSMLHAGRHRCERPIRCGAAACRCSPLEFCLFFFSAGVATVRRPRGRERQQSPEGNQYGTVTQYGTGLPYAVNGISRRHARQAHRMADSGIRWQRRARVPTRQVKAPARYRACVEVSGAGVGKRRGGIATVHNNRLRHSHARAITQEETQAGVVLGRVKEGVASRRLEVS